jgi:hypothetical protein
VQPRTVLASPLSRERVYERNRKPCGRVSGNSEMSEDAGFGRLSDARAESAIGRRGKRPLMRSPRCRALSDCATRQGNIQEAQQEHTCGCSNGQNIVKVRPATPIEAFIVFRCEPTVPRPNIAMIHQAPKPLQYYGKQCLHPTTAARVSVSRTDSREFETG